MYTQGVSEVEGKQHRFVFIAVENHRLMPATSLKPTILSYRKAQKTLTTIFTLSKSVLKQVTGTATTAETVT